MRIFTISAALAALLGGTMAAQADGMYGQASFKDAVAATPFSWTGLYFGGSAGFGAGTTETKSDASLLIGDREVFSLPLVSEDSDLNGAVYGLHVGYNIQRGHLVYGLEATLSGAELDSSRSCGLLSVFKCESELDYYGTVVGRLGYAVDKTLFYVTGGLAYGEVSNNLSLEALGFKLPLVKDEETAIGWTAGVGIEHAMTDRFIVRIEYAHIDLGDETGSKTFDLGRRIGVEVNNKTDLEFDTIRIGASYKLGDRHEALESLK